MTHSEIGLLRTLKARVAERKSAIEHQPDFKDQTMRMWDEGRIRGLQDTLNMVQDLLDGRTDPP